MKKVLLLAATLFIVERSSAQFSVAPEAGVQMTTMSFGSVDSTFGGADPDYRIAYRAGINLAYDMDRVSIHAGAFFSAKGYKSDMLGVSMKLNTNYIDVPVYVNYNIINNDDNKLFIGIGPYVSYCMNAKVRVKGSILGFSIDDSEEVPVGNSSTDVIKSLDFGGNANIGFITSMGIYARASYSMGLANISNSGGSGEEIKNSGFALSVGYQIKL